MTAVDLVPDHGLLAQTEVVFDPGLSLAYTAQVVEALTPVLDRVANGNVADRYLNVRSVVVGYPHRPWGQMAPDDSTVATCVIKIDVPLR